MKTIALGVDGMEPSLCDQWVNDGKLPNIQELREDGAYGTADCKTLISARQWTNHFTGVGTSRHGVHGFMKRSDAPTFDTSPGTRVSPEVKKLITTKDIGVKTYPELLDEDGVSVGVINALPLWPPLPLENGFCISGMVTPPTAEYFTHPESLADELADFGYRIDVRYGNRPYGFIDDPLFSEDGVSIGELKEDMFDVLESRIEYIKHCLEHKESEFIYGLLKSIDIIQHTFWGHMRNADSEYGETILEAYRRVDSLIGWIRKKHPDTNMFVFSDHGFGPRRSPRSALLQSVVYGIDGRVSVPYKLKAFYRAVFKREPNVDSQNINQITGDHDNPAAWMLFGPDVRSCKQMDIKFDDITPTLLALHDHPVPKQYIGRVVKQAVSVKPRYTQLDLRIDRSNQQGDHRVVSERLYNLGYAEMVEESHGDS